jgi:hypothetical protein
MRATFLILFTILPFASCDRQPPVEPAAFALIRQAEEACEECAQLKVEYEKLQWPKEWEDKPSAEQIATAFQAYMESSGYCHRLREKLLAADGTPYEKRQALAFAERADLRIEIRSIETAMEKDRAKPSDQARLASAVARLRELEADWKAQDTARAWREHAAAD